MNNEFSYAKASRWGDTLAAEQILQAELVRSYLTDIACYSKYLQRFVHDGYSICPNKVDDDADELCTPLCCPEFG